MTEAQAARTATDWTKIAGDRVTIEEIKDVIYGFTSELGALRLFHKFSCPSKCRAGYSQNMGSWFFSVDLPQ